MQKKVILAVGDMVADILLPPLGALPDKDSQLLLDHVKLSPGGNTLNFALAAAAQGVPVEFHGAHGDDAFGEMLKEWMRDTGVKDRSKAVEGAGTATTVAIPGPTGSRRLLTYPGANALFKISRDELPLESASHLHIGGYWFLKRMMGAPVLELLEGCRERGIETSLDPATDPAGWGGSEVKDLQRALPFISILFVNRDELLGISGSGSVERAAEKVLALGCGKVILHKGEEGASLFEKDAPKRDFSAFQVGAPLNPTGCGDVFNGAFVASLSRHEDMERSIRAGMAAASLHIGSSTPLYPDRRAVERLIQAGNR